MRVNDRDLIRGEHYGQRSCEPHQQAEHMAAPTNAALVKKVLANSEPSTHDPKRTSAFLPCCGLVSVNCTWKNAKDRVRCLVKHTELMSVPWA